MADDTDDSDKKGEAFAEYNRQRTDASKRTPEYKNTKTEKNAVDYGLY